jgi:predicted ATPase
MNSIGFKNFRSLENTGMVDIKSLNILVGKNNSGKSSFLRAFPLMRQSVEKRIIGPILWYGNSVDFGSFEEALFSDAKNNNISLLFNFEAKARGIPISRYILLRRSIHRLIPKTSYIFPIKLQIDIGKGTKGNSLVEGFHVTFEDVEIDIRTKQNKFKSVYIDDVNYTNYYENGLIDLRSQGFLQQIIEDDSVKEELFRKLVNEISKYNHHNTKDETLLEIAASIPLSSSKKMLSEMQKISITETWKKNVADWSINSDEFVKIRDLLYLYELDTIISIINEYLDSYCKNIRYIAPVRATAERYYRRQNLAVDEIDFRGQNIAMFLSNLTSGEMTEYNEWTESILGVDFSTSESSGQISIQVSEKDSIFQRNLADTGFGYSQILPIITQLWFLVNQRRSRIYRYSSQESINPSYPITFALEQPELHLHPAMQAKLVNAFLNTIKEGEKRGLDIRLIVETHSEAIINKLGHLIYLDEINSDDVNIVVFEGNKEKNRTDLKIAKFDENGYLLDWPIGFFEPEVE